MELSLSPRSRRPALLASIYQLSCTLTAATCRREVGIFAESKVHVISNGEGKGSVHRRQTLSRTSISSQRTYNSIPSYTLQCPTSMSFFTVLTGLQAKVFLNSRLLRTRPHRLLSVPLQPSSKRCHAWFSTMDEIQCSGQGHSLLQFPPSRSRIISRHSCPPALVFGKVAATP